MNLGSIIGIGLKIVSNREKIAAMWDEIVPIIRKVTELFPQVRSLIEQIVPGVTAQQLSVAPEMSVEWLQESLNKLGADPVLVVDGDYGELTKAAVSKYQEAHPPLEADGWAGVATQASIYDELAKL